MRLAIILSYQNLGASGDNPSVGAVLVREGKLIARARTEQGGRPHAERLALEQAGEAARGATLYVTLEPCAHEGRSGSCAKALVAAGVARVVIACCDPNPLVAGQGIVMLRAAGIEVEEGLLSKEAEPVLRGFFTRMRLGRPWVMAKVASTLDGKIALGNGKSKWITGDRARSYGHLLRAQSDAILTATGTVLADNPRLDVRLKGLEARSPLKVLLDSRGLVSPKALLFKGGPVLWVTYKPPLTLPANCEWLEYQSEDALLQQLGARGINRLMLEGGQGLFTSFLKHNFIDELAWFRASKLIGNDGHSALGSLGLEQMEDMLLWRCEAKQDLGLDTYTRYVRLRDERV